MKNLSLPIIAGLFILLVLSESSHQKEILAKGVTECICLKPDHNALQSTASNLQNGNEIRPPGLSAKRQLTNRQRRNDQCVCRQA